MFEFSSSKIVEIGGRDFGIEGEAISSTVYYSDDSSTLINPRDASFSELYSFELSNPYCYRLGIKRYLKIKADQSVPILSSMVLR